jgi:hypothetical protein
MSGENQQGGEPGILDSIGRFLLTLDTRWLIIGSAVLVAIYLIVLRLKKGRWLATNDTIALALSLLQIYSAVAIFCTFVLTKPPAVLLLGELDRQSAGLLATIFLLASVFAQIRKVWTDATPAQNK